MALVHDFIYLTTSGDSKFTMSKNVLKIELLYYVQYKLCSKKTESSVQSYENLHFKYATILRL